MPVTPAQIEAFLVAAQARVAADYERFSPGRVGPKLVAEIGKRYVRIVSENGVQRSAFCFVDMETGNVLKPKGWKGPTLNFSRGNIADEHQGCARLRWTGVG